MDEMVSYGRITATASYLPPKVVTNDDLAKVMETSDEWIASRTGIRQRHIAENENTSDLCIHVANTLLQKVKKQSSDLDFIIIATMTPDYHTPSVACMVQGAIQATNAYAFDISVACSGFVYALSLANKLIQTGAKCGLVIGGEVLSKMLDWQDRSTAVLFGDGAAGVVLEASDQPMIVKEKLYSNGSLGQALTSGLVETTDYQKTVHPLQMEGRAIFDFATRTVVQSVKELLADEAQSVDYFLLHQANARILDIFAKKLQVPREKFLQNIQHYGNTSAATIPLLLDEAVGDGTIILGGKQKIILTGFGGGLTWGNLLLQV
ncbi:beta-ketoacyl-acyl-carrier-protein synthase III [Enterococcus italicus DSM 15952]|uniref:Beta-ketoacyl-[acyl-carrier-protein] synthase III n=2 Tax=Enterococcus italicus TaxID=246144 RepID=E6LGT8_ENTI1|nr:beta-ketoacyl-acyl-carrier-protein synthase III [Enterococcus italicus DSM 15952]OJG61715.1 3-oxoacyl-ACP synthase [Enterococcus italicus DSM 15952]